MPGSLCIVMSNEEDEPQLVFSSIKEACQATGARYWVLVNILNNRRVSLIEKGWLWRVAESDELTSWDASRLMYQQQRAEFGR